MLIKETAKLHMIREARLSITVLNLTNIKFS